MHFSTAITALSAFALLSTSVAAEPSATFDTWDNLTCDSPRKPTNYQRVEDNRCEPLPNARSLKVYWTRDRTNCKGKLSPHTALLLCEGSAGACVVYGADGITVNVFSLPGCDGTLTSFKFEADAAPCKPLVGAQSYNVTC